MRPTLSHHDVSPLPLASLPDSAECHRPMINDKNTPQEAFDPGAFAARDFAAEAAINRANIAAMLISCVFLCTNDAIMKFATGIVAPSEMMFLRGCIATLFMLAIAIGVGDAKSLGQLRRPWVIVRSLGDLVVAVTYIEGLSRLPLGDVTSIMLTSPLMLTGITALMFREAVGPGRWAAILAGFFGVVLIAKPTMDHFDWPILLVLGTALTMAVRDLVNRRKTAGASSFVVAVGSAMASGTAGLTLLGQEVWRWPTGLEIGLAAIAGVLLGAGNLFIILAFRRGDVSVVSPFRYASVPIAVFLSMVVFGTVPDWMTGLGIVLIVAAGLGTMHLDRLRLKKLQAQAVAAL